MTCKKNDTIKHLLSLQKQTLAATTKLHDCVKKDPKFALAKELADLSQNLKFKDEKEITLQVKVICHYEGGEADLECKATSDALTKRACADIAYILEDADEYDNWVRHLFPRVAQAKKDHNRNYKKLQKIIDQLSKKYGMTYYEVDSLVSH